MVMVMVNDVGREPYAHTSMPVRRSSRRRSDGRTDGRPIEVSRGSSDRALLSVTDHGPSIEGRARESEVGSRARDLTRITALARWVTGCAKSGSSSPGAPVHGDEWVWSFREPRPAMSRDTKQITKK